MAFRAKLVAIDFMTGSAQLSEHVDQLQGRLGGKGRV